MSPSELLHEGASRGGGGRWAEGCVDRLDPPVCDPLPDAQPLCCVISIFSCPRLSAQRFQRLCNCLSDRPIYFSPPTSLENTPSVLSLMSRGSARQAGACLSKFLFLSCDLPGQKMGVSFDAGGAGSASDPHSCVCGISFPEFLFRECLETVKPAAGFLRDSLPALSTALDGRTLVSLTVGLGQRNDILGVSVEFPRILKDACPPSLLSRLE